MADRGKEDPALVRFRQMSRPMRLLYARPRTFIALAVGILVSLLLPGTHRLVTRLLFGWDALIAVYLGLVYAMMLCNDHRHIRRAAAMQDDGRFVILLVTATGAFASIAAIVSELGTPQRGGLELTIAIITIVLSYYGLRCTRPSRCITRMIIIATVRQVAFSFRAATRKTMPTIGISSISPS
ncbi:putative membrane protein [Bradyrhizobium liaoningense]